MNRPRSITPTAESRADRWIRRFAGTTVVGLAGIAGAISYSHMRQLAAAHSDAGWHAHAFPLSVDGIESVASLVLLADRRNARRSGWLPWAAPAIGTTASVAANVATADTGTISRIIAGWPALALLIAVKVLSGILEHQPAAVPDPAALADEPGPVGLARPAPAQTVAVPPLSGSPARPGSRDARRPQATRDRAANSLAPANTSQRPSTPDRPAAVRAGRTRTRPGTVPDIAALLPSARAARDELRMDGRPLTRDALAARLRQAGHSVRNARLTPLLQTLQTKQPA